ncbi:DUF2461 domain-containing protein [Actinomadura logoneensis]|uniref:DUF2461 domain-containing protein n=1 Tax=Actinomadura logoneensis TaxID=2293572 RepID=A0A372JT14_9ACTN|nr:DUF2461 domain-containing protein [Actinomadura logoneensis]RFU43157.1 DUF2461 domain-containing protein [Actinomadura logoneensis]
MSFDGFDEEAFAFYEGLLADNSRDYWTANRARYERHVREPMLALLDELEPEFGAAKLFRPYRDVRFSKDKTPYKDHQGALVFDGSLYVEIDADGMAVAGGMYSMQGERLKRFRAAVHAPASGKALETLLDDLRGAGMEIAGETLKTRPRGFDADHPRIDLLRHTRLYARQGWPADPWMETREVIDRVADAWRRLRPLGEWAQEHVGPPDFGR